MAITYSSYSAASRLAATVGVSLHELLRDPTDLLVLCQNKGDATGSGSAVDKITTIDLDDTMSTPTEGNAVTATDPTVGSYNITVVRHALMRSQTDLMGLTGGRGMFNMMSAPMIAQDAANLITKKRTALIAALFSGVSGVVDRSGQQLTFTDILQGQFTLQDARNSPPFAAVLYPHQLNNIQSSLRGESGALQNVQSVGSMVAAKGPGYAGSSGNIDFWSSDAVPADSTDRVGCLFARGAFAYREADAAAMLMAAGMVEQARLIVAGSPVHVEFDRTAAAALSNVIYNYYFGVSEQEDARAVGIKSAGA